MWSLHTVESYSARGHDALAHATARVNRENITELKKSDTKNQIVCDSIYMKYPEEAKVDSWLPGTGGEAEWDRIA